MRILHTGDWHMNERLGRIERAGEIERTLGQIAGYLESESVDVMVVAGDIFSEQTTRDELSRAVSALEKIFGSFLARGGTMIAVSGNHDREVYFDTLRAAMGLAPGRPGPSGTNATGRLHLYTRPGVVKLAGPGGEVVQFALMPYPGAFWLREKEYEAFGESADGVDSPSQRRRIQDRFTRYLNERLRERLIDPALQTVFVSHILIEGTEVRSGYKLDISHDVAFLPRDVPDDLAYVAYGHIHKAQEAAANAPHARYCGSIARLDHGEAGDPKSVALVEVGPKGRVGEVRTLPLDADPLVRVTLGTADATCDPVADLRRLQEEWSVRPERERVLIHYTLHYLPGVHSLESLRREIHTLFPRWHAFDPRPVRPGADKAVRGADGPDLKNVLKTTTDYVTKMLEGDPRKDELLAALRDLFSRPDDAVLDAPPAQASADEGDRA